MGNRLEENSFESRGELAVTIASNHVIFLAFDSLTRASWSITLKFACFCLLIVHTFIPFEWSLEANRMRFWCTELTSLLILFIDNRLILWIRAMPRAGRFYGWAIWFLKIPSNQFPLWDFTLPHPLSVRYSHSPISNGLFRPRLYNHRQHLRLLPIFTIQ